MRFCEPHWKALRMAIDDRGLSQFVADGGADVVRRMTMQMGPDGKLTAASFEPLMSAHMAILSRLMEIGGLEVMRDDEDGTERCPICYANEQHLIHCPIQGCDYTYDEFINRAADDQLTEARQLGLIPTQ